MCQYSGPVYDLYQDPLLDNLSDEIVIPAEIYHGFVRAQISIMVAQSSQEPFSRYPTNLEMEEMAKSIVIRYPAMKDSKTNHVSLSFDSRYYVYLQSQQVAHIQVSQIFMFIVNLSLHNYIVFNTSHNVLTLSLIHI